MKTFKSREFMKFQTRKHQIVKNKQPKLMN